jgi:hypothetical protein
MPQRLDGIEYPESIPDACYTDLLERSLIQLQDNITSDVVSLEGLIMTPTLDVG